MELLITRFYNELDDPMHYSASRMELGEDVGKITWNNAVEDATEHSYLLDTTDKVEAFENYIKRFGAWDQEEIDTWPLEEKVALLIQFISSEIREAAPLEDLEDSEGRIFKGIDGEMYFYIGE